MEPDEARAAPDQVCLRHGRSRAEYVRSGFLEGGS